MDCVKLGHVGAERHLVELGSLSTRRIGRLADRRQFGLSKYGTSSEDESRIVLRSLNEIRNHVMARCFQCATSTILSMCRSSPLGECDALRISWTSSILVLFDAVPTSF